MKYQVKINSITSIDEVEGAWTKADYAALLSQFGFSDPADYKGEDPREFLMMAIADNEPGEAAEVLLTYKLSDDLNEGQISQISSDMQIDKISEEYPEINLHYPLFNINQLLYKSFNGKFPHAKASLIDFEIKPIGDADAEVSKEMALKAFAAGLTERSILNRLLSDQLAGTVEFKEADNIVWEMNSKGDSKYTLITSEYWLSQEDFGQSEFEGEVVAFEGEDEE